MIENIQYLGILSYIISVVVLCAIMLFCGYFLGGRSYSRSKNIPFESGVVSVGNARTKFPIKFYLIAMIFLIFDAEGIYLYIWSIAIRETGWSGFSEVFIFIVILVISLIYVIRLGSFDWIEKSSRYRS